MLNKLVSSNISLSVSETTLLRFLNDFGIWRKGKFEADSGIAQAQSHVTSNELSLFSYDQLYTAKDIWLASIRDVSASDDIIKTQKNVISILYRWGQLNGNDFSEPQSYIMKLSEDAKWLQSYLFYFHSDTNAHEMLPFIPEGVLDIFIERTVSLAQSDKHASSIAEFLRQIQKTKTEKDNLTSE